MAVDPSVKLLSKFRIRGYGSEIGHRWGDSAYNLHIIEITPTF